MKTPDLDLAVMPGDSVVAQHPNHETASCHKNILMNFATVYTVSLYNMVHALHCTFSAQVKHFLVAVDIHICTIDNTHASWIRNSLSAPQSINIFVLSPCAFRAYNFD